MPRIREYNSQVGAGGQTGGRAASAMDFGGDGGLTAVGSAGMQAADFLQRDQENQEASRVHLDMSQAMMDWTENVNRREKEAKPGDMGYAPGLRKEMGEYFTKMADNYQTPKAKELFAKMAGGMTTQFFDRADKFQVAQAGVAARADAQQIRDNNTRTLLLDPASFDAVADADSALIRSGVGNFSHLDQNQREALIKENRESYAWAANYGAIERDPMGWLKASGVVSAADRVNGVPIGGVPGAAPTGGFDKAVTAVLAKEGGFNNSDGNSKAPVNFGINQRANPDIDVKNLTKEKAVEIYRERYWNPIGGDNLPAPVATFAFDAAVNMGVPAAQKLLNESGGDLGKMVEMRKAMYQAIVDANPDQAKYLKTWTARTDRAAAEAMALVPKPMAAVASDTAVQEEFKRENPSLADLKPEKLLQLIQHAETRQNQIMAVNKAQLEQSWRNQSSQAMTTGNVGSPMSQAAFVTAYGKAEGVRKYNEEYVPMLELGAAVQRAYGATNAQQEATLASMTPAPDSPGYAEANKRVEVYRNAVNLVRQQRTDDPVNFAIQAKLPGFQTLDMSTPEKMADGVAQRVGPAKAISESFGTQAAFLTKPEAEGMGRALREMPTSQKLSYLEALRTKVNDPGAFKTVIGQIAPDSPVTMVAASLLAKSDPLTTATHWFRPDEKVTPKEVAGIVMEGEALLNKTSAERKNDGTSRGFPMPQEALLRQAFNSEIGNAFAGMPGAADTAYQAARAYYAGKSARTGDLAAKDAPNTNLIKEAVKAVAGGVYEQNSTKVLMPWGMPEDKFQESIRAQFNQASKALGMTGPAADIGKYGLQGVGDGKYFVKSGADFLKAPNGQPIVLDVYNAPTTLAASSVTPAPAGQQRLGPRHVAGTITR